MEWLKCESSCGPKYHRCSTNIIYQLDGENSTEKNNWNDIWGEHIVICHWNYNFTNIELGLFSPDLSNSWKLLQARRQITVISEKFTACSLVLSNAKSWWSHKCMKWFYSSWDQLSQDIHAKIRSVRTKYFQLTQNKKVSKFNIPSYKPLCI
jgi:hypothetical protein